MQTFLPSASFACSAASLDAVRLGNQLWRETLTLYNGGWPNHPAAVMWAGHKVALARYGVALGQELLLRAFQGQPRCNVATATKWLDFWICERDKLIAAGEDPSDPAWLGDERLHSSHRACLLAKDPAFYAQFGWAEKPTPPDPKNKWPYYWPTTKTK